MSDDFQEVRDSLHIYYSGTTHLPGASEEVAIAAHDAIVGLIIDLENARAEVKALREAAQVVVNQRNQVASGYELFARVNILTLSHLAELLQDEKG